MSDPKGERKEYLSTSIPAERKSYIKAKTAYQMYRGNSRTPLPHWDDLEEWVREAVSGTFNIAKRTIE